MTVRPGGEHVIKKSNGSTRSIATRPSARSLVLRQAFRVSRMDQRRPTLDRLLKRYQNPGMLDDGRYDVREWQRCAFVHVQTWQRRTRYLRGLESQCPKEDVCMELFELFVFMRLPCFLVDGDAVTLQFVLKPQYPLVGPGMCICCLIVYPKPNPPRVRRQIFKR